MDKGQKMISGMNVLANYYLQRLGFFRPYLVTASITLRCNLRCKQCNLWKISEGLNEIQLKEWLLQIGAEYGAGSKACNKCKE